MIPELSAHIDDDSGISRTRFWNSSNNRARSLTMTSIYVMAHLAHRWMSLDIIHKWLFFGRAICGLRHPQLLERVTPRRCKGWHERRHHAHGDREHADGSEESGAG